MWQKSFGSDGTPREYVGYRPETDCGTAESKHIIREIALNHLHQGDPSSLQYYVQIRNLNSIIEQFKTYRKIDK